MTDSLVVLFHDGQGMDFASFGRGGLVREETHNSLSSFLLTGSGYRNGDITAIGRARCRYPSLSRQAMLGQASGIGIGIEFGIEHLRPVISWRIPGGSEYLA